VATARSFKSDAKLIIGATVAVLLAGFLIAGAALIASGSRGSLVCPSLNVGSASDIRRTLTNGGPIFQTGGASCGFYLALVDGNIVAYKAEQPGCTLQLKRDHWECGGHTVPDDQLAQYPVSIQTVHDVDAVIVDLRPVPTGPTTTTGSSLPRP
jgi:hypothetical protein